MDEVGQPISEDCEENALFPGYGDQQDIDFSDDFPINDLEPTETDDIKDPLPQQPPPEEGTKANEIREIFPQIVPKKEVRDDAVINLKRSDSALNIFDQTTILKLFSAKNWTETFFNRIFRKKFLVISPGDETVFALKNGFAFDQQTLHISQFYPRELLPAIAAERDKKLTNGLFLSLLLSSFRMQDVNKLILALELCAISRTRILRAPSELFVSRTNFEFSSNLLDVEMTERNSDDSNEMDVKGKPFLTATNQDLKSKVNQRRCVSQPAVKIIQKLDSLDKKSNPKAKATTSYNKLKETATNVKNMVAKEKKTSAKSESKIKASTPRHHHYKHFISHYNSEKQQKVMQQQYFSQQPHQGLNISMDFRVQTDENGDKSILEENSNLFLYLDLHGHASKKGVFMYGNHLPNTLEAVEVMLLPRLMSMNCHHFAFDACNFSERNMYLK